jgi:hypothetical protein
MAGRRTLLILTSSQHKETETFPNKSSVLKVEKINLFEILINAWKTVPCHVSAYLSVPAYFTCGLILK